MRKLFLLFLLSLSLVVGALGQPTQAQKPQLVVDTGPGFVTSMAFSPDGQILASGGRDHAITLWDVAGGSALRTLDELNTSIYSLAFSPDGRTLAEGQDDGKIKLWDVDHARELRGLAGHSDTVTTLAFSPDGQILASGSYDATVKLWSVSTGELLQTLTGHKYAIYSVAFSPDGRIVAAGGQDHMLSLWDVKSRRLLQTIGDHSSLSIAFSPKGQTLAVMNGDDHIRLWDVSALPGPSEPRAVLDQQGRELGSCYDALTGRLAFSPDGGTLAVGGCNLRLWDVAHARELRSLENSSLITAVAFSSSGRLATATGFEKAIQIWDSSGRTKPQILADHRARICALVVDPHGRALAARTLDGMIKLWDVIGANERQIRVRTNNSTASCSAAFDPSGRILAGANDHSTTLWSVATGKELLSLSVGGNSGWTSSVLFDPGGRTVASSESDKIHVWDAATGKELRTLLNPSGSPWVTFSPSGTLMSSQDYVWEISDSEIKLRAVLGRIPHDKTVLVNGRYEFTFSPDGRTLASCDGLWDIATGQMRPLSGCNGGSTIAFSHDGAIIAGVHAEGISLWDAASGRELRTVPKNGSVSALAFSPNNRILAAASADGRITLWEVSSGHDLATLFLLDKGDWAILDPAGRFDASPRGRELMHWSVGLKTIDLSQLKDRYYEPGLLGKILGLNKEPLRDVAAFTDVKLYPEVSGKAPVNGSTKLNLSLADLGGGIGRVQVFVNGTEFSADARGPGPKTTTVPDRPGPGPVSLTVDLANAHVKPGEANEIRVVAWNAEGSLSSRGFSVDWEPGGARDLAPPEFYAIVVGVSDYSSPQIQLHFAAKDAQEASLAFRIAASRLFGAGHVHMTVLTNPTADGGAGATKANIKKAFDEAAKTRPGDVFLVYLAGHGVAIHGIYAYPTTEARTLNLSDPAVRLESSVSDEELVEWIKKVPSLHKVMILDTCAAGAIEGQLLEKRGIPGDQVRAIERLKDRTGFYVLMGSAADAPSYEATQFGQGLLTYALLRGMKGTALRDGEFVDVATLFQKVADDVPELAKDIGGIQQPRIAMPGGASFDIGQLSAVDRVAIPLATAKPLLLRPVFLNTKLHRDDLRLSEALQKFLRMQSYASVRGGASNAIYVDQDDFPGAVSPSGDYTIEGNKVSAIVVLTRDGRELSQFKMEGRADDIAALVTAMAAEINRAVLP